AVETHFRVEHGESVFDGVSAFTRNPVTVEAMTGWVGTQQGENPDWGLALKQVLTHAPEDWANSWKQYWHVQHVTERLVLCPSWEAYEPETGEIVIQLDPGMAFGTGTHPTTRLMLQQMERLAGE